MNLSVDYEGIEVMLLLELLVEVMVALNLLDLYQLVK
jgi:hypothetical protein